MIQALISHKISRVAGNSLERHKYTPALDFSMLVVKAKIKDVAGDLSVASDFADALNEKIESLVKEACKRAMANGRRTVMAKDL